MSTLRVDILQTLTGVVRNIATLIDGAIFAARSNYASDAEFNAAKAGKLSIDGAGRARAPLLIAGDEELSGVSNRDAVVVGRGISNTDCHAFADRTIMDNVTDYGGYGTFDSTPTVRGGHLHNHVYSFQDRTRYEGSGTLESMAGLYSRPEHRGSGTILDRWGARIYDLVKTGTGSVTTQVGLWIDDLKSAGNNVAITALQTDGYVLYAPGGARSYFKGGLSIGRRATPTTNGLEVSSPMDPGPTAFLDAVNGGYARVGGLGDYVFQIITAGRAGLEVLGSAGQYAIQPGANATQDLGTSTRRFRNTATTTITIGSGSQTIVTGAGSPEGVVTAAVGSMYLNSLGGASTTLYVKASGTGNTGWIAK